MHRFATGHTIQVVVAASDAAYAGNAVPEPVTISTSPLAPSELCLPMTAAWPSERGLPATTRSGVDDVLGHPAR